MLINYVVAGEDIEIKTKTEAEASKNGADEASMETLDDVLMLPTENSIALDATEGKASADKELPRRASIFTTLVLVAMARAMPHGSSQPSPATAQLPLH